jgi:hypothetical protein
LDYIPKECFIDRRAFSNTEEVHRYLLTVRAEEYSKMQQSIANFMSDPRAQLFDSAHFAATIADAIAADLLLPADLNC